MITTTLLSIFMFFKWIFIWFFDIVFVNPIRVLYLYGPSVFGVGGWGGARTEDMCHQLTSGVPSQFWVYNEYQCEKLIDQHVFSVVIAFYGILYMFFFISFLIRCTNGFQTLFLRRIFRPLFPSDNNRLLQKHPFDRQLIVLDAQGLKHERIS